MSEHEDKFREAIIEFLAAEKNNPDRHLVHWVLISNSVSLKDSDADLIGLATDTGLSFSHEMGLLDYAQTILKGRVMKEDDE